jgi:hypothetical protein
MWVNKQLSSKRGRLWECKCWPTHPKAAAEGQRTMLIKQQLLVFVHAYVGRLTMQERLQVRNCLGAPKTVVLHSY